MALPVLLRGVYKVPEDGEELFERDRVRVVRDLDALGVSRSARADLEVGGTHGWAGGGRGACCGLSRHIVDSVIGMVVM